MNDLTETMGKAYLDRFNAIMELISFKFANIKRLQTIGKWGSYFKDVIHWVV